MGMRTRVRSGLERVPWGIPLARLTLETTRICLRYRVTGLAAEGAFFMLLSLPPLVLGIFGGLGFVGGWIGPDTIESIVSAIEVYASRFLSESSIKELLLPTIDDVLRGGRFDIISVGFLLSLWSGSRALNVFVDTVSIMYGQKDARGIVHLRAFSLLLYSFGIVSAVLVLPLMLLGPELLSSWLPDAAATVTRALYWPAIVLLGVLLLASMYHVATPRRAPWRHNIPGAVLAMAIWLGASYVVRISLEASMGGTSIYGPLSTPIVLLIWLYALAVAILIGAGLNAAVRTLWPVELHEGADVRLVNWAVEGAGGLLSRPDPGGDAAYASHASSEADHADHADDPGHADEEEADLAGRGREQQYESTDRGPLRTAIERGVDKGAQAARQAAEDAAREAPDRAAKRP
ncbi:YihY/virulence factor BrkB family protein [Terrabacter sp. GCM10028922]|uniref:YihY/virulence factor BrkB family protein n=1 Tax=Terrabacter sp. GCM10028922 TaxID=3273428 RepID=UPI00361F7065